MTYVNRRIKLSASLPMGKMLSYESPAQAGTTDYPLAPAESPIATEAGTIHRGFMRIREILTPNMRCC